MDYFSTHIKTLKRHKNPEKMSFVKNYEKTCGKLSNVISENIFYTEYLEKFHTFDYRVYEELTGEFDQDLLLRLIVGSSNTNYHIVRCPKPLHYRLPYINILTIKEGVASTNTLYLFDEDDVAALFASTIEDIMTSQITVMKGGKESMAMKAERRKKIENHNTEAAKILLMSDNLPKTKKEKNKALMDIYEHISKTKIERITPTVPFLK